VEMMEVHETAAGQSTAACWRFLGADVINFQLLMNYSSIYTKSGGPFFEEDKTNCFRFLATLYIHLWLAYDLARKATTKKDYAYWRKTLFRNEKVQEAARYGLSFYRDLQKIAKKHPKMKKTFLQIKQQCKEAAGAEIHQVQFRLNFVRFTNLLYIRRRRRRRRTIPPVSE